MAFFTIFTGLVVMITSLSVSKFQRIQEAVLLRTLGAKKRLVQRVFSVEYFFLGLLSSLIGIVLSFAFSWVISYFVFDTPFMVPGVGVFIIFILITGLTLTLGLFGNRRLYEHPPLEILRAEV